MSRNRWHFGNHEVDNLPEVLRTVLKRCLNGGSVVIEDRRTGQFVQFRKYILAKGDYGLELGFPDAPWSRAFFPKLRDALTAKSIRFRETGRSAGDITNFLHVDCGKDIAKAVEISRLCFFGIFNLARDTRFKSTLSDYASLDEQVDDPNFKDHGLKWWSVWRVHEQAAGRPDPALVFCAMFWTVALQVAFVVLWICWFKDSGAPGEWGFAFGPLTLAGSYFSLVSLVCFGTAHTLFSYMRYRFFRLGIMSRVMQG